jgi:hypothetical protein
MMHVFDWYSMRNNTLLYDIYAISKQQQYYISIILSVLYQIVYYQQTITVLGHYMYNQ